MGFVIIKGELVETKREGTVKANFRAGNFILGFKPYYLGNPPTIKNKK